MSTGLTYDPIRELPIWESGTVPESTQAWPLR
jgi:hypothetical protein